MERLEVYRRCRDVRFRTILDEGVVVRIDAAEVVVLNGVGARILELVDGERTLGEIVELLRSEFDVAEERLFRELEAFVVELSVAGILEPVEGSPQEVAP